MTTGQTRTGFAITSSDVDEIRNIGSTLFQQHKDEAEPDSPDLSPHWKGYYELEERGALIVLVARHAGEILGYAVGTVLRHHHYDRIDLFHDLLYVVPEHRGGGVGLSLLYSLQEEAIKRGADGKVFMHAKPGSTLDRILQRLGYLHEETIYQRDL